jgi:hypothetical protein
MRLQTTLRATVSGASLLALAACGDNAYGNNDVTAPPPVDPAVAADAALAATATGFSVARSGAYQTVRATSDIKAGVDAYRALLGATANGGTAGEQPAGRREINWDGVPAAVTNTDAFPADFFRGRGIVTSTTGAGFRVADDGFASVNAAYAGEFNAFSPAKTFAAVGSAVMEVRFFVAGSTTPALVTGFGAVFADVGRSGKTTIEYYDAAGAKIATVAAPTQAGGAGLSFAGVVFDTPLVARVRITSGEAALGAAVRDAARGGTADLVVLDDFLYGEPHAVR